MNRALGDWKINDISEMLRARGPFTARWRCESDIADIIDKINISINNNDLECHNIETLVTPLELHLIKHRIASDIKPTQSGEILGTCLIIFLCLGIFAIIYFFVYIEIPALIKLFGG